MSDKPEDYGTDEEYQAWCRDQPSAFSGDFTAWPNGKGRNIYAHSRSGGVGGTAYKPPFSGIPLTDNEHRAAHQYGDSCLSSPEWWKRQVRIHLARWIAEKKAAQQKRAAKV